MNEAISLQAILDRIQELRPIKQTPVVIALDGGSGAGKSTFSKLIEQELQAAVIPLDDFFSANVPDHKWDEFTVEEKLSHVLDWERVRKEVLTPLLQGKPARWHAFDFAAGLQQDGTYRMEKEAKERHPASILVIEGAYSCSPQLADLVDLAILIDVPIEIRHARIAAREEPEFLKQWHQRWDEVEQYYSRTIRPKNSFDLVIEATSKPGIE